MDRSAAGEYSFLLSIPAILGALVLTLGDAGELGAQVGTVPILAGFLSAMVVGYFALTLLMTIVRAGRISLFALYLIPLGIWGLITFA
jgi:undecaprenyl-diphosphatase